MMLPSEDRRASCDVASAALGPAPLGGKEGYIRSSDAKWETALMTADGALLLTRFPRDRIAQE